MEAMEKEEVNVNALVSCHLKRLNAYDMRREVRRDKHNLLLGLRKSYAIKWTYV